MRDYMGVTTQARSLEGMLTALLLTAVVAGALAGVLLLVLLQGGAFVRDVLHLLPL
jgi:hypothetical protein